MGLFNIFKKNKTQNNNNEPSTLLAMLMFNSGGTFNLDQLAEQLRLHWNCAIGNRTGNTEAAVLQVDGQDVMLATIPAQIPWGDIEGTAQYAYNWPTAETELKEHNSHVIVSALGGTASAQEQAALLTKVIASIFATTNAIGVYKGAHTLLIPKSDYLATAEILKQNAFPLSLWVYIGLRKFENKSSLYTYGLKEFGKTEMEIIDSDQDMETLYNFLHDIGHYVLVSDITLKDGETLGHSAEEKIEISLSDGKFVEGQSLKLAM